MELTALKVKIGKRINGNADHPNFNILPVVQSSAMDWCVYVDEQGAGWSYDKKSGHNDEDLGANSPRGIQWGLLLVPTQFAQEAVSAFPSVCSIVDEVEATTFYEQRAVSHLPEEEIDEIEVKRLNDRLSLMKEVNAPPADIQKVKDMVVKALDPNDPSPGVRKNWRKRFADFKAKQGITIKKSI